MKKYIGTCHCGKVKFSFNAEEIEKGIRCNCSICKRLGVVMSPRITRENLEVLAGKDLLKVYLHGDKEIKFTFCNNCGIYAFYEPVDVAKFNQCRVNLGCVEEIDTFSLEIVFFDGKNLL
jgi:hypothetical protein